MNHRYEKPDPALSEYVRTVLVLGDVPDAERSDLPLFTNGLPALLCKVSGDSHRMTLFGLSIPVDRLKIEDNATLLVFFFKPFALGATFGISAQVLRNAPVDLETWNARKAMAVNARLRQARSARDKTHIVSLFLLDQIQANRRNCAMIRLATDTLMHTPNAEVLARLLRNVHVTERTFQRIFKKYVGITPNEYRRLCQVYAAFSHVRGGNFETLTDVAVLHGYFDQSHFIHAFREFAKTSPGGYVKAGLK